MKVLILHFRSAPASAQASHGTVMATSDSAGTDGVSLEMKKRQRALAEMGHDVEICSAYDWADLPIPSLEFDREEAETMMRNLFGSGIRDYSDEAELERAFRRQVEELKQQLGDGIGTVAPEMLFVHNVLALPVHPVATVALAETLAETRLPCVAIHHDILSEGAYKFTPTCEFARSLLGQYFPPRIPNLSHWTINTRNQTALAARGVSAEVIHDTMDFRHLPDTASQATMRRELRARHGIEMSDVVLFVGARLVPNKQVELAAHLAAALKDLRGQLRGSALYHGETFTGNSRVVLVLAGRHERAFSDYEERLLELIAELGVDSIYVGDEVLPVRVAEKGFYALYPDMYAVADIALFPSGWEGFGNQLLEAFAASLPTVVFEYPVFKEDIAPAGVRVISLGDDVLPQRDARGLVQVPQEALTGAAQAVAGLLVDRQEREKVTNHNIAVGVENFSFDVLRSHLSQATRWASALGA